MGKTRVCGKQCHNAKTKVCRCWCGGLFHGSGGEAERAVFKEQFQIQTMPTTEMLFDVLTHPRLFDSMGDGNEVPRRKWRDKVDNHVGARALELLVRRRKARRPKGE